MPDQNQMMQQMMMQTLWQMSQRDETEGSNGLTGAGKAHRRLHSMHDRVTNCPEAVVADYIEEWVNRLGLEPGDRWQMSDVTKSIAWGRLRGLHRCHFHASNVLNLMMKGKEKEALAYQVQFLRALHQVNLDGGVWTTAMWLLPKADPIDRPLFGDTAKELETIAAYQEALKKLQSRQPHYAAEDETEKTAPKKKC